MQAHREAELVAAEARLATSARELKQASAAAKQALAALQRLAAEVTAARKARAQWDQAKAARQVAAQRLTVALGALAETDRALAAKLGPVPAPAVVSAGLEHCREQVSTSKQAADAASRLRGRLERRPQAELAFNRARERAATGSSLVDALRSKVKSLAFDAAALARARQASSEAEAALAAAETAAREARVAATRAGAKAEAEAKRYLDAQAQHERLGDLESASVHLGRTAELLNGFRNSVVASVGRNWPSRQRSFSAS